MEEEVREIRLKKGEVLFRQGEECSTMFLLIDGEVNLYLNYGNKNEYLLEEVRAKGSSIGEMGLLASEKRNSTAICVVDALLYELDEENVYPFLSKHPRLGYRIIKDLSLRFRRLTEEFLETKEILFKTLTIAETRSLKGRLRRFVSILTDIPEGVPPDLYIECYARNHHGLN